MAEDVTFLGPLELTGGIWGVGDATRPGTHWVEFRPDGLHQHEPDAGGRLVPWSRIMTGIWFSWNKSSRSTQSKGEYTLWGTVAGRSGGWMHMTLRDPYEDHALRFDRHARRYRSVDAVRLEWMLRHLVDVAKLPLLGDPEWVGRAVAGLAGGKQSWSTAALRRVVAEAVTAAGPGRA
ncbi:hypothetical protein ACFZAU_36000 [Streptomyces sp. NPDC008238]